MIKFYLFGSGRAESRAGVTIPFATAKSRALLAYLAMTPGQWHTRQHLADLLWPTATESVALSNLRNTLARLRKSVDNPEWLQATRQGVQVVGEPHQLWTDAIAFDYLWGHLQSTDPIHALLDAQTWQSYRMQLMAEAITLYQGEFLAGLFWQEEEEGAFWQWRRQKQEEYHTKALVLLDQLAEHALATGDYRGAAGYARGQLALERWRERAHRQLMLALASSGDYAGALSQYERCRQIIHNELGVEPETETYTLLRRLQAERQLAAVNPRPKEGLIVAQSGEKLLSLPAVLVRTVPHNLPAPLSPFIGRANELQQLHSALRAAHYRIHVVLGPGGVGKSRLALEVAAQQLDYFLDGVFFVPLAEVYRISDVAPAIAQALALPLQTEGTAQQQLATYLQTRHLLLILDGVEQLLDEGAPHQGHLATLILALVQKAPALVVLVTSRQPLQLRAENLFWLAGLTYPPVSATTTVTEGANLAALLRYDAVSLFVEQARRVRKEFSLAEEATAVLQICQRLEGIPLGIELAAAHVQHTDCATILANLTQFANGRDRCDQTGKPPA